MEGTILALFARLERAIQGLEQIVAQQQARIVELEGAKAEA